jgi:hypothetical protein
MIKFLDSAEWTNRISTIKKPSFNEKAEFVNAIASNFSLSPHYIVYEIGGRIVVSLVAYTRRKTILDPLHFVYSTFWVAEHLSDSGYSTHVTNFLNDLKKYFDHISLNLGIEIRDARPFIWSGFTIKNRYTYIKDLVNFNRTYPNDVVKSIKELTSDLKLEEISFSKEILDENVSLYRKLNLFSTPKINKIVSFFEHIANRDCLRFYICSYNSQVLASSILFVDNENKKAFTVFVSKGDVKNFRNNSVHAFFYDAMFKDLTDKGYVNVDLLGANTLSVSKFKSKFRVDLAPYFMVKYSKRKVFIANNIDRMKRGLIRILNSF